jgi:hypothetical protein
MRKEKQCTRCPKRASPKRNRPTNADSRKNAKAPSIARVWAITSSAKRENAA